MVMTYKGAARYKRLLFIGPPPGTSLDAMFSDIRRVRRVVRYPSAVVIAKGKDYYHGIRDSWRGRPRRLYALLGLTL